MAAPDADAECMLMSCSQFSPAASLENHVHLLAKTVFSLHTETVQGVYGRAGTGSRHAGYSRGKQHGAVVGRIDGLVRQDRRQKIRRDGRVNHGPGRTRMPSRGRERHGTRKTDAPSPVPPHPPHLYTTRRRRLSRQDHPSGCVYPQDSDSQVFGTTAPGFL
ncbi:hypothetical protein Bbelb_135030 [Branchiostoma belcheri]|nr:hypothetical protein Bbelb_135030 [Branchiostoma belcheri]